MDMLENRLGVGRKFHQRSVIRGFGGTSALFIKTSTAGAPYPLRRYLTKLPENWLVLLPEHVRTSRDLGAAATLMLLCLVRLCLLSDGLAAI